MVAYLTFVEERKRSSKKGEAKRFCTVQDRLVLVPIGASANVGREARP